MKNIINFFVNLFKSKENELSNKIVVEITSEDMKKEYKSIHNCPLASALKRKFPNLVPIVGGSNVSFYKHSNMEGFIADYRFDVTLWCSEIVKDCRENNKSVKLTLIRILR